METRAEKSRNKRKLKLRRGRERSGQSRERAESVEKGWTECGQSAEKVRTVRTNSGN